MWEDIIWWIVLVLTIISFLVIPGLIQILIDEIKEQFKNKQEK